MKSLKILKKKTQKSVLCNINTTLKIHIDFKSVKGQTPLQCCKKKNPKNYFAAIDFKKLAVFPKAYHINNLFWQAPLKPQCT